MKASAVPPHIAARYRMGTPWWTVAIVAVAVAAFSAAVAFATWQMASPRIEYKLLAWRVVSDDHTEVTFEVRRGQDVDVWCVVRAQDFKRIDVAYATVPLARGTAYVQVTYPLRTLAPAFTVEVLACEAGGPPTRVIPPQFPPGVVPPEQPWTPQTP